MLLTLSGRGFIKIQYSSFPLFPVSYPFHIATQLQYYVKCEKCNVNDVKFPSGCETRAINLGNKNMKTGIFTGATSVRLKSIFTNISRYPTRKHEINMYLNASTKRICQFCTDSLYENLSVIYLLSAGQSVNGPVYLITHSVV